MSETFSFCLNRIRAELRSDRAIVCLPGVGRQPVKLAYARDHQAVAAAAIEHGYRAGVQLHKIFGLR